MNKTIFFVWGVVLIVFISQNWNLYKFVESLGDGAFFLSELYWTNYFNSISKKPQNSHFKIWKIDLFFILCKKFLNYKNINI